MSVFWEREGSARDDLEGVCTGSDVRVLRCVEGEEEVGAKGVQAGDGSTGTVL